MSIALTDFGDPDTQRVDAVVVNGAALATNVDVAAIAASAGVTADCNGGTSLGIVGGGLDVTAFAASAGKIAVEVSVSGGVTDDSCAVATAGELLSGVSVLRVVRSGVPDAPNIPLLLSLSGGQAVVSVSWPDANNMPLTSIVVSVDDVPVEVFPFASNLSPQQVRRNTLRYIIALLVWHTSVVCSIACSSSPASYFGQMKNILWVGRDILKGEDRLFTCTCHTVLDRAQLTWSVKQI